MTDELFDIFFSGKVLPDNELETVKQKVGALFNANAAVLEQLFSGKAIKIKKSVDMNTAIKYRVKFRDIGAIVDIRPSSEPASTTPPQTEAPPPPADSPPDSKVAAPATASDSVQADAPSALETSLAEPGSIIDETPAVPPAEFSTDEFELGPANQGSLEEFAETVIPAPIPDISALDVSTSEEPLDTTPPPAPLEVDTGKMHIGAFAGPLDDSPPPPPADIDTSSLTATAPNTGSLEEFDSRPEAVPLPDISKLKME